MKGKFICLLILFSIFSLKADLGTLIPSSRLPSLEVSIENGNTMVYPWANSGSIKQINQNYKVKVKYFINVQDSFSTSTDLQYDIQECINTLSDSILFYFPAGTYELDDAIDISSCSNIIFKGEDARFTTIISTEPWYYGPIIGLAGLCGFPRNNLFNVENSEYIGFEDLRIETIQYTSVDSLYEDSGYDGMFINMENSSYCWVSGCELNKAQRHAMLIWQSNNIEIRGSYFDDAWSHGGGGNGYGIQLFGPLTRRCLIEDNIFQHFRHAVVLSEECKYNVIGYNYIREGHEYSLYGIQNYILGQICFHGAQGYLSNIGPEYNLCEGNIAGFISVDDSHGSNGIYNTIFRNRSYDQGIQSHYCNTKLNIVNNLFRADEYLKQVYGFPWKVANDTLNTRDHFAANNKCQEDTDTYWRYCKDASCLEDSS